MELTAHQHEALAWLVGQLTTGKTLVALRGYAGSGKTTMIPYLRDALRARGFQVCIGAPTHRAVMVLRSKGLNEAETVHSLATLPSFAPDYVRAVLWLGGKATACSTVDDILHEDVESVPFLIAEACQPPIALNARALRSRNRQFSAQRLLDSLGIRGQDFFREFLPREANGCLILDEASMVDAALLDKCQHAFPSVLLVGDPGQLPPVDGASVLAEVEGFTLTEIHRQAQESPIIQLATQAREGALFWRYDLPGAGEIVRRGSQEASVFLTSPLLVYRNAVRTACTRRIRAALGYPLTTLVVGEPLVCRSTDAKDRESGFYNNAMFRIAGVHPDDPRLVTVVDDTGHAATIYVHLEELDGDKKDPRAIWFRFGYVITVHTAQGGEWPTGYISQPELQWYYDTCVQRQERDLHRTWAYTAITRAKQALVFLMQHTFTPPESESPMAETPVPPSLPEIPVPTPEPDDIPDPVLPETLVEAVTPPLPAGFGEHEALLQGFCQHLQGLMHRWMLEEHHAMASGLDATLVGIRDWAKTVFSSNEHASYQLSDALLKWQEHGLQVRGDAYKLRVQAVSPQGLPVVIEVAKPDAPQLVEGLEALLAWLVGAGFRGACVASEPVGMAATEEDDEIPF